MVPLGLAVCLSLFGDLILYVVLITQLDVVGLSLAAVGVMLSVNRRSTSNRSWMRLPTTVLVLV